MQTRIIEPKMVCAKSMVITLEGNIIKGLKVTGGCAGLMQAIDKLVTDQPIIDVAMKLANITCGNKGTSCADQLSIALFNIFNESTFLDFDEVEGFY